jgi:uncharacterized protein (TIGR03437 family)
MLFRMPDWPCFRAFSLVALCLTLSFAASAQTVSCLATAPVPIVHAEGLAEPVGTINLVCSGGVAGTNASIGVFITLNTNVTNRLDVSGNVQGITLTPGVALTSSPSIALSGSTTLLVEGINYVVPTPSTSLINFSISGIRAAAGTLANGTGTNFVQASFLGFGMQYLGVSAVPLAQTSPSLLYSAINNGIPCAGAPLPPSIDFPSFLATNYSSSAVRITEGVGPSFSVKGSGDDTGLRIVVKFAGYGSGVRLFVPDAIVGNTGATPTSGGAFGVQADGGTFLGGSTQLLLSRVNGASSNGIGGTVVISVPGATTAYTTLSELPVSGGSAYVVYEVISSNPAAQESAQVPVFLVTAPNNCSTTAQTNLSPSLAPVSTVTVATATDPIPRFLATTPGSDCQIMNDCSGSYFPKLSLDVSSLTLNGSSLGNPKTTGFNVRNLGGSQMPFKITTAYQSGSGWLTVSPTSGVNSTTIIVTANPGSLQPGTFNATITVDAGAAGQAAIPVTFNVGPQGVTIQGVVSAASFQPGAPISSGSIVAIFGLNLGGTNVSVTFNGQPTPKIYYDGATQINAVAPNLGVQNIVSVVVTVDGNLSDPFPVPVSTNSPAIFNPGIANANTSTNSSSNPAKLGETVAIYMSGLADPLTGPVTVNIGSSAAGTGLVPTYAGLQGTYPGMNQVNVTIPPGLTFTGNSQPVKVCVTDFTGNNCSLPINLYLQ